MSRLSLIVYEPLVEQGLYAREFIDDITGNHEGYNHVINVVGGYESAAFTLKGTRGYLDDWFEDGLFRRVVLYNPEGIMVWEGFVNRIRYSVGTLQKTKTLDNLFNRVYLRYSPLDTSVSPPVASPPETTIMNDLDSQASFGVKSIVVSGGERTDEEVFSWAEMILNERAEAQVGESVNTLATDNPFIEIEAKGYYHTLKWVPYEQSQTGIVLGHQVIIEVLQYFDTVNPGWIPQDFGWMDYNFKLFQRGYNELLSCWDVIANVIRQGGLGGERWVGGLYQNRKMTYKAAEGFDGLYGEYVELWRSLEDPSQRIYDDLGTEVKPWDMVPDRVLRTVDVR